MDFTNDLRGEEDDVFYSELRRQVLLLTEEDDEILQQKNSARVKFGHERHITTLLIPIVSYFNWLEYGSCGSVPSWLSGLWRTSNGTGVFIPHAVRKPRRQRSRRNKNRNIYHQRGQNTKYQNGL